MVAPTSRSTPLIVTDATFAREVLAAPLPVLVDFWAPWCPPCRAIAPVLSELAAEYAGRIIVAKLNTDENQLTYARLGVQGLPTLIVFSGGSEIERLVGARPRRKYQERIDALLR